MSGRTIEMNVFLALLRKPRSDPDERRTDPLWEFGSFGCTGCHQRNLLHPGNADSLNDARIAFAQGGPKGFRLVLLTPPISVHAHRHGLEIKWKPIKMPFRYERAPLLVDNSGDTDFRKLLHLFEHMRRSSLVAKFASAFRARSQPLPDLAAREIIREFERAVAHARPHAFSNTYLDALPYKPPNPDYHRDRTYAKLLRRLGSIPKNSRCRLPTSIRKSC